MRTYVYTQTEDKISIEHIICGSLRLAPIKKHTCMEVYGVDATLLYGAGNCTWPR